MTKVHAERTGATNIMALIAPDDRIHVDFESRSTANLLTLGSTIYAQHWTTTPLMLSAIHGQQEALFDFMEDESLKRTVFPACMADDPFLHAYRPPIPAVLAQAIENEFTFVAHNARFEQDLWYWICHLRWGWPMPRKWSCTAARARYWGLRASLDGAASDLELPIQKQTKEGKEFINTFCKPRKWKGPIKDGKILQLWAEPHELPAEYAKGKEYCLFDSRVEKSIDDMLDDLPFFEQKVWELDFKINTHGIPIDTESVSKAIHFSDHYAATAVQRFNDITGVNPTQRDRVLEYVNAREEMDSLPNLQSKTLSRIAQDDLPDDLRDVINIRLDCSRASVKKLQAMVDNTSPDGFARGLFLYYGAHTGRWSAKRIQPHNFIRGDAKHAKVMFNFLEHRVWEQGLGDNSGVPLWIDHADLLFPRPLMSLSRSMRGFIKAPDGQFILSGDYAQIEARVLAWLANCESLLMSFAKGEDTYVRFAAENMYFRRYEDYFNAAGKVHDYLEGERQRAKSAVLGCGFQLGAEGFRLYCDNLNIIITLEEAEKIIKAYRAAYPEISDWNTGLWARANYCAIDAVQNEGRIVPLWGTEITYHVERLDADRWWLICSLPSGRHIAYYRPKADKLNQYGRPVLSYRTEWRGGTYREDTYGGKLVENVVQAIARDICALGAINADNDNFRIIGLVHDEVITLSHANDNDTKLRLKTALLDVPDCYAGLPLNAEVKSMKRYTK